MLLAEWVASNFRARGSNNYRYHKLGKVMINVVDLLENVFNLCMYGCDYPAGIVFACTDTNCCRCILLSE